MKKAVLLVSHGSFSPQAKKEILMLVRNLRRASRSVIFKYAFLEINRPSIPAGIERCVKAGAKDVTILLNFLNSGVHVREDILRLVRGSKRRHPEVSFSMSPPIGVHNGIVPLFLDYLRHLRHLKKI